jgi:itaconate CoA-transferase
LQQPALATDERFASNSKRVLARQALRELIVAAFSSMTVEEVIARLDQAQIANARMNDMRDVWQHEQLRSRQRWVEVDTPAGPVPAMLPPGTGIADAVRMDPVPALGEHTDAILAELGYAAQDITALRAAKAI